MKAKLFTIAIVAIIGIAVIGCKEDDTPEHVHNFGTAWVKNATQHWHECSCGEKADVANHTWDWVETRPATTEADGEETETCTICGQTNGTKVIPKIEPVTKTYDIVLKDGALTFTVEYKALPSDEEPAYLAYLETRLGVVANSTQDSSVEAVDYLLTKGDSFNITIVYTGESFEFMNWDIASQSFKIHNDWISTASDTDLSAASIRTAFNSVTDSP